MVFALFRIRRWRRWVCGSRDPVWAPWNWIRCANWRKICPKPFGSRSLPAGDNNDGAR